MRRVERSIAIDAPAARVWEVLVDFARYPEWNPFITSIEGEAVPGARLKLRLRPPGRRSMTFRPRVLVATPGRELRWLGHLFIPGLFDGEHSFVIEPVGARTCRFHHGETFRGALVGLFRKGLDATGEGFDQMNRALKERAEQASDEVGQV